MLAHLKKNYFQNCCKIFFKIVGSEKYQKSLSGKSGEQQLFEHHSLAVNGEKLVIIIIIVVIISIIIIIIIIVVKIMITITNIIVVIMNLDIPHRPGNDAALRGARLLPLQHPRPCRQHP